MLRPNPADQHVLWRIDHGILDGLTPLGVVVLIGVNNLGNGYTEQETLSGIRAVVASVHEPDGTIAKSSMSDFLHPTASGYVTLTNAVEPWLNQAFLR